MATKKRVPEIRFQGFSGEWDKKEFVELVYRMTAMSDHSNLPRVEYEDIISGESRLNKDVSQKSCLKKGIEFKPEDILFGKLRPYLNNCLLPSFKGLAVGDFWVLRANASSPHFVYYLTQGIQFQYIANVSSGSKMPRADWSLVSTEGFFCPPCISEQSQIGSFFQNLDAQITLHQRKLSKLDAVKKSMLEKMFPREGAAVPEIRFQGFQGKWESKRLGEIYTERNERGNESLQILSVSIHTGISSGELDDEALGKQVRRSKDKSLYKHVYAGDIVLNMMRAWQGAIGVATIEGMVSPAYITAIPNGSIYPLFMDCSLRRVQIIAQMDNLSYGVTDFRKRLYWDSFVRVESLIPSVPEQQKIAVFFTQLDSLISLQQRELDKLRNIKQAYLEKMFV